MCFIHVINSCFSETSYARNEKSRSSHEQHAPDICTDNKVSNRMAAVNYGMGNKLTTTAFQIPNNTVLISVLEDTLNLKVIRQFLLAKKNSFLRIW